ncbi:hypothetical protein OPT61_g6505 [Boeremia exigua]|uniref:Uncharacterized protein n=1 Tax=Boeremia exigua TaxID=749465 RepID=A0ACC2I6D5_9PLEO|nr:hypothetical protein OPT61_g6505 [Boeremia exigua]
MGKSIRNWFIREGHNRELLSPLQELTRNHEAWSTSVLTLVEGEDRNGEQKLTIPSTYHAGSLSDAEFTISQLSTKRDKTHAAAQSSMILASTALAGLKAQREVESARKAGVDTQKVLSDVSSFLQGFSGIAEIVKAADQQFGGLAYGTVSVLATVAAHKTEREDFIEEVLEELAHAFPRLNILEHIEPRDSLRALMIGAFEMTIHFCRRTTEYCTANSMHRIKEASLKRDEMLKTVSRLRIKLSEIHKECELIMVQDLKKIRSTLDAMTITLSTAALEVSETKIRLQEVQARGKEVYATGEDTNNRVREGQAWMERQEQSRAQRAYLSELKKSLAIKDMTKAPDAIHRVRSLLRRLSENQEQNRKHAAPLSPEMLQANKTFRAWNEEPKSSMLVLGGHNFVREPDSEPGDDVEMSWLSAASAWYTEDALRKPGLTLSYFGQLNYSVRKQHRHTFWYVIKTFIYQLAQVLSEDSLERHEAMISGTDIPAWDAASDVEALEHMTSLLVTLLGFLPEDLGVSIIIDRLDHCQWEKFTENAVDGLGHAVRFLLQLVRQRKSGLKILLVLNNRSAVAVARTQKWTEDFFSITDWHQEAEE